MSLRDIATYIRLLFRKDRESYFVLYRIMGFFPCNIRYYEQALLHKSLSVRNTDGHLLNNERLEFLGDAILDAVVGDIVYQHFQGKREGFLTNQRSKIVQRETLNRIAVEMGLNKLIKSSSTAHSHNSYVCGNAFEAFVGAIYLDRGYKYCMRFMEKRVMGRLIDIDKLASQEQNFKSKLIEWGQKRHLQINFELVDERLSKQEACSPIFESQVLVEGIVCGRGVGYSKKESQQLASKHAMKFLKTEKEVLESVYAAKEQRERQNEIVLEESVEASELEYVTDCPESCVTEEQTQLEKDGTKTV